MKARAVDVADSEAVQGIDGPWMTRVLAAKYPGLEVVDATVTDVIQGSLVKIRVELGYNEVGQDLHLPPTMIIKGLFGRHETRYMGPTLEGEMFAYRDVVGNSRVNAPTVYFAGYYPSDDHPIVIMEDLATRRAVINSSFTTLTFEQAVAILDNQAQFHAQWWQSPLLDQSPISSWIERVHGDSMGAYVDSRLIPHVWEKFFSMPRGIAIPHVFRDVDRMRSALERLRHNHTNTPVTAVHGDFHLGNTFLEPSGRGGAFDWNVRRGGWQHDVAYFVANALDVMDRRQWERALLHRYLHQLEAAGVEAPSLEEAWLSYQQDLLYGVIIWIANGDDTGQFQPEAINTAGAVRHTWAALDHDTLGLLAR